MSDEIMNNSVIEEENTAPSNFIYDIIDEELASGKIPDNVICTRFPPEPNGYLHIEHAKAICIDFGTAIKYGGKCNLRFDDTNPSKEDVEYVESIQEDVKWLGFNWDNMFYASEYFAIMYDCALKLIKTGKAFVCDLTADQIREHRGTLTEPGKNSPYRDRSIEENLDLFEKMKSGEFPDGSKVLRAKIDMASPNINMRDPVIYRILRAHHHRTGNEWCIYPMYDYAHPIEDVVEGITHSLCSLEFEDHRPLYDWVRDNIDLPAKPRQIEFARLNLAYTQMSKRKLLQLVNEKFVDGWDDPRMPTISGLRRRGYTPGSIRTFCEKIGVAKNNSLVDFALLEHCIRDDLNFTASRVMAVLRPLKVVIENYPEGQVEWFDVENNPENPDMGTRKLPFSREIYIEQDDFMENPPNKFFRLAPGKEVRLKNTYFITCQSVIKDEATGEIIELRCTYDPASKGGNSPDGRKVKGTLHWVSASHAVKAEVCLYDHLFMKIDPEDVEEGKDFRSNINPDSLEILENCMVEPDLVKAAPGDRFQFLRMGYYCVDTASTENKLIFNRTVGLKDTWAKVVTKG